MVVRVEWIGVKSPSQVGNADFLMLSDQYNEYEQATLEAVAILCAPRIRWDGKRSRIMGPKEGLSKHYRWGRRPGSYIQTMSDSDAKILFASNNEFEFRRVDDSAHADRKPIVDKMFIDQTLYRMLLTAKAGKPVSYSAPVYYDNPQDVVRRFEEEKDRRGEHDYRF